MKNPPKPWKYDVDILRSRQYEAMAQGQVHCDEDDNLWLHVGISFDAKTTTDAYIAQETGVLLLSEDRGLTWTMTDRPHPRPPGADRVTLPDGTIVTTTSSGWVRYPRTEIERLRQQRYYVWDLGEELDFCAVHKDMWMSRSRDGGDTWALITIADGTLSPSPVGFGETYPVVYGDGRVFVMVRTELGHHAYCVSSAAGGSTWTQPRKTPIRGKHPRPTLLRDGTILITYQRRFALPYGVRARFTPDHGETWSEEVIIRDDIPVSDGLHQPNTVEMSDGTLFTTFDAKKYYDDGTELPFVGGSRWTRTYRRPLGPKLAVPEPAEKYSDQG